MDNNDDFNSLGLEGVTLREDLSTTNSTPTESNESVVQASEEVAPVPTESAPIEPTSSEPATSSDSAVSDSGILNDLSDEETIDLFIEGIMIEKGVEAPTEEIKQDLKKDLKDQLLHEIDRSLIGELPDDKLEELSRMAAANGQIDPEVIAKMVEEANLDVTDIVGTTMVRFREIYLGEENSNNSAEA